MDNNDADYEREYLQSREHLENPPMHVSLKILFIFMGVASFLALLAAVIRGTLYSGDDDTPEKKSPEIKSHKHESDVKPTHQGDTPISSHKKHAARMINFKPVTDVTLETLEAPDVNTVVDVGNALLYYNSEDAAKRRSGGVRTPFLLSKRVAVSGAAFTDFYHADNIKDNIEFRSSYKANTVTRNHPRGAFFATTPPSNVHTVVATCEWISSGSHLVLSYIDKPGTWRSLKHFKLRHRLIGSGTIIPINNAYYVVGATVENTVDAVLIEFERNVPQIKTVSSVPIAGSNIGCVRSSGLSVFVNTTSGVHQYTWDIINARLADSAVHIYPQTTVHKNFARVNFAVSGELLHLFGSDGKVTCYSTKTYSVLDSFSASTKWSEDYTAELFGCIVASENMMAFVGERKNSRNHFVYIVGLDSDSNKYAHDQSQTIDFTPHPKEHVIDSIGLFVSDAILSARLSLLTSNGKINILKWDYA